MWVTVDQYSDESAASDSEESESELLTVTEDSEGLAADSDVSESETRISESESAIWEKSRRQRKTIRR